MESPQFDPSITHFLKRKWVWINEVGRPVGTESGIFWWLACDESTKERGYKAPIRKRVDVSRRWEKVTCPNCILLMPKDTRRFHDLPQVEK